jgi:hypothetical protein
MGGPGPRALLPGAPAHRGRVFRPRHGDVSRRPFLQGRLYSIENGQPLTILATFAVYGAGLLNIAARVLSESSVGTILAPTYEYGCAYLLTAGLMNLLLILDAHDIARGRKP